MSSKMKIKKGDTVLVIAGKARGKTGKVLRVEPEKERVVVERLNMIKRHHRPSPKNPPGHDRERVADPRFQRDVLLLPLQ